MKILTARKNILIACHENNYQLLAKMTLHTQRLSSNHNQSQLSVFCLHPPLPRANFRLGPSSVTTLLFEFILLSYS